MYVIGTCKLCDIETLNYCTTLNYCAVLIYYATLNYDQVHNKYIEDNRYDSVLSSWLIVQKFPEQRTVSFVTTEQKEVLTTNF